MINHLNQNIFASKIAINMAKKLTKIIKFALLLYILLLQNLSATISAENILLLATPATIKSDRVVEMIHNYTSKNFYFPEPC